LEKLEKLSINLKFIIEGEEESGSHSLARLLPYKKEALKADHILIIDAGIEEPGQPAISLGARGLTCMTVHLTGSGFDLHSGAHGGIVYNPNQALIELLSPLHDATRSISIPGFYDDIIVVSESEKSQYHLDFDEKKFEHHFKAKAIGMEKGVQPLESAWMRPTLEINGLSGGYSGPGFKTVIPSKAMAKISCRLVPNQDPYKIAQIVKNYLISHIKPGIEIEVEIHPGNGKPLRTNPQSKIVRLMEKAFEEVFQKKCHRILLGGSIPIAADLAETAGGEMLLVGVGLPTDQIHAPDEHFDWERFEQGFLFMATALQLF
jgi:acetylornithine deacetylase/succinyl-diaminopimelate desuccinylase-like protein